MRYLKRFISNAICLGGLLVLQPTQQAAAEPTVPPLSWYIGTIQADVSGSYSHNYGWRPSIAVSPVTGGPYVSSYDSVQTSLDLAYRMETPSGSCNGGANDGPAIGWQCSVIDAAGNAGDTSDIAFEGNSTGRYGIAYDDPANNKLTYRRYESNGQLLGTIVPSNSFSIVRFASLVYYDSTAYMAHFGFNGSGPYWSGLRYLTSADSSSGAVEVWQHGSPPALTVGYYPSIDIDSNGKESIAYRSVGTGALRFAQHTGTGSESSCELAGSKNTVWRCQTVDPTVLTGHYISLYAAKGVSPTRIAYYDQTNGVVKLATYTGSGNCNGGSSGWQCAVIDSVGSNASRQLGVSLSVSGAGMPAIAYIDNNDQSNSVLKLARYVASGGNCGPSNAWHCEVVDAGGASDDVLESAALAYANGIYYIAYHNSNRRALMVAHTKFTPAPGFSKSYSPASVFKGGKTKAIYTITNNMSSRMLGGLTFSDFYGGLAPTGTFDPASLHNTCGGVVTFPVSSHAIKLSNGILAKSGACTLSADLLVTVNPGTWHFSTSPLTSEAEDAPAAVAPLTVKHGLHLPLIRK